MLRRRSVESWFCVSVAGSGCLRHRRDVSSYCCCSRHGSSGVRVGLRDRLQRLGVHLELVQLPPEGLVELEDVIHGVGPRGHLVSRVDRL